MNSTSNRTYAILGTGALGGYYGACLQRAGLDVHFLLRSDYEHVKEHGLIVESPDGDFTLPHVNAYQDVAKMPACDVVVVALKTTQNHLLPEIRLVACSLAETSLEHSLQWAFCGSGCHNG